jgi:DNA modification methylase
MLYYKDDFVQIHHGNALEVLRELPSESVQYVITSPPYWGLRNYAGGSDIVWGDNHCGHEWGDAIPSKDKSNWETFLHRYDSLGSHGGTVGHPLKPPTISLNGHSNFCLKCGAWRGQLGLEPTPELYVEHLMMIFSETKRVLRKDGSFYLNIGDTYGGSGSPGGDFKNGKGDDYLRPYAQRKLQPKCMACIPERILFAMLEDHWILRNKIIWHKRNHMPGSQKDRFTQSWEYLYFFTKSRKYYFDLDAIRVPHLSIKGSGTKERKIPFTHKGNLGHSIPWQPFNLRVRDVKRGKKGTSAQGGELKASEQEIKDYEYPEKHHGSPMNNKERLHRDRTPRQENIIGHFEQKGSGGHYLYGGLESLEGVHEHPKGKNPGDLWSIATKPSSISVCPNCETVFSRLVKICPNCKVEGVVGHFAPYPEALCIGPIKASSRVGDIILDPFAGGGTTGMVAKRLGRQAILIDCVKPYCIMAKYKVSQVQYQLEMESNV